MAARARARAFCEAYGLRLPVIMAPMAGACPPKLAAAVAGAGGMGACGATPFGREGVERWVAEFRQLSTSSERLLLNLWTPDPAPARDEAVEAPLRGFLAAFPSECLVSSMIDDPSKNPYWISCPSCLS